MLSCEKYIPVQVINLLMSRLSWHGQNCDLNESSKSKFIKENRTSQVIKCELANSLWNGCHVPIDLLHNPHNTPVPCPTMQHFVTEMCTCVHISVTKCWIVGYVSDALWDLWDGYIEKAICGVIDTAIWRYIVPLKKTALFWDAAISLYLFMNFANPKSIYPQINHDR